MDIGLDGALNMILKMADLGLAAPSLGDGMVVVTSGPGRWLNAFMRGFIRDDMPVSRAL